MADPKLPGQGFISVETITRMVEKLEKSEAEMHRAAYQAIIDAAEKARKTNQAQMAGFECMGCAFVVLPPV